MMPYAGPSAVHASIEVVAVSQGSEGAWAQWAAEHAADFRRLTCGDSVIHPPSLVTFASLDAGGEEFILDWLEGHVFTDQPNSNAASCYKAEGKSFHVYPIGGSVQFGGAGVLPGDIFDRIHPILGDIDLLVFETMPSEYPGSRFIHFLYLQH